MNGWFWKWRRRRSYISRVLALAPIAYWPLDDQSGTVMRALAGANGSYKASGEPLLGQSGPPLTGGVAPRFDGTNDFGNAYTTALRDALDGSEGAASLWLQAAQAAYGDGAARTALEIGDGNANRIVIQKLTTANTIQLLHRGNGTSRGVNATVTASDAWRHACLVWSATGTSVRAYLDGVQQGATQGAPAAWSAQAGRAVLGAFSTGGSNPWSGGLAHAALWDAPLAGADVARLARCTRVVIFDGDSRTAGTGGTVPYHIAAMATVNASRRWGATNLAVSGQTLTQMSADAAAQVYAQARADCPGTVVLWGGVNDVAGDAGETAETVYAKIETYVSGARAAGLGVVVCTELPASNATMTSRGWNTIRAALNTLIRDGAAAGGYTVADLAANTNIGEDGDSDSTTYYNADKLHLNDTGYGVVAGIVAAVL